MWCSVYFETRGSGAWIVAYCYDGIFKFGFTQETSRNTSNLDSQGHICENNFKFGIFGWCDQFVCKSIYHEIYPPTAEAEWLFRSRYVDGLVLGPRHSEGLQATCRKLKKGRRFKVFCLTLNHLPSFTRGFSHILVWFWYFGDCWRLIQRALLIQRLLRDHCEQLPEGKGALGNIDFNVTVLTTGFWPSYQASCAVIFWCRWRIHMMRCRLHQKYWSRSFQIHTHGTVLETWVQVQEASLCPEMQKARGMLGVSVYSGNLYRLQFICWSQLVTSIPFFRAISAISSYVDVWLSLTDWSFFEKRCLCGKPGWMGNTSGTIFLAELSGLAVGTCWNPMWGDSGLQQLLQRRSPGHRRRVLRWTSISE